jgi:hypothetical protein
VSRAGSERFGDLRQFVVDQPVQLRAGYPGVANEDDGVRRRLRAVVDDEKLSPLAETLAEGKQVILDVRANRRIAVFVVARAAFRRQVLLRAVNHEETRVRPSPSRPTLTSG